MLAHSEEIARIGAAHVAGHSHAHERAHGAHAAFVLRSVSHCASRCRSNCSPSRIRIANDLHILQPLLVLISHADVRDTELHDLYAAALRPILRKLFFQRIRDFLRVTNELTRSRAQDADFCKSRLKRRQKLTFELAVNLLAAVFTFHITANLFIEKDWIDDVIAVLTEALDVEIGVDSCALVHHAERNRSRRSVFVANDFFRIEVIDTLILTRIAAERKTASHLLEGCNDTLSQVA